MHHEGCILLLLIDGVHLEPHDVILYAPNQTCPAFFSFPNQSHLQSIPEGTLLCVREGVLYGGRWYGVMSSGRSLVLMEISKQSGGGSGSMTSSPLPPGNATAKTLVWGGSEIRYLDGHDGGVRLRDAPSGHGVQVLLGITAGRPPVPPVEGSWTLGQSDGSLNLQSRIGSRNQPWTLGLDRGFAWCGFGWQDVEWTMNDLNVSRTVRLIDEDAGNLIPCLHPVVAHEPIVCAPKTIYTHEPHVFG